MIIKELTGDYSFMHPGYPCSINFDGLNFPSVLHASLAAMTTNPRVRELIATSTVPVLIEADSDTPISTIWDKVIDFQLQKYSKSEFLINLLNFVDKDSIIEYDCKDDKFYNRILGKVNGSGFNMIGVITKLIIDHGTNRESIVNELFSMGVIL